jgi:hypothetical protein
MKYISAIVERHRATTLGQDRNIKHVMFPRKSSFKNRPSWVIRKPTLGVPQSIVEPVQPGGPPATLSFLRRLIGTSWGSLDTSHRRAITRRWALHGSEPGGDVGRSRVVGSATYLLSCLVIRPEGHAKIGS